MICEICTSEKDLKHYEKGVIQFDFYELEMMV